MEELYVIVMVTKSGFFYDLAFTGLFDDAYRFAKRTKEFRTDKIYEIRLA